MRNISALKPILDRAAARAEEPPTYRFHGRRSPKDRDRTPILGKTPSAAINNGVAKLRLYEPIDSWGGPWGVSAIEFLEVLDELDGSVEEIRLHINSPGGEVWEALAILNSLRAHDSKLVAVVDGIAASCASFIACAADETIMSPNTQLMIHDAWGMCVGNESDMLDTAHLLGQVSDNIAAIYADRTEGSVEDWRATMKGEAWYSAQEAVDAGLADKVAGQEPEQDPTDAFDLSIFKFEGRDKAPAPEARAAKEPTPRDEAPVPDAVHEARVMARRAAEAARRNGVTD
jgi:ATP-dependent Clp endopeptidase proteolytic subunit ClpP